MDQHHWKGRRVLVTGHTGFKGSWLAFWLCEMGAVVYGVALPPATDPNLFDILELKSCMNSTLVDVRDREGVRKAFEQAEPQTVFHLASQPLVRRSIADPFETVSTNVVGLVNVLDAARSMSAPPVFVNVTSDKVYENDDSGTAYTEDARLGGADPYSASKACAEILTRSFRETYEAGPWLVSARAGNVIGGGDWSEDRLVPDLIRSVRSGNKLALRYPHATRPWQHVLEPLSGYLLLAQKLAAADQTARGAWNFGPSEAQPPSVGALAQQLLDAMRSKERWTQAVGEFPKEKGQLHVDSTRARTILGWRSRLTVSLAVAWTARWYAEWLRGGDLVRFTRSQIEEYAEI